MKVEEFLELILDSEKVESYHESDLKELAERYPYFFQARMLWLKSLQKSESIHTGAQINRTVIYAADQRQLYFCLYPERRLSEEQAASPKENFTGSYFDLLHTVEKDKNPGLSLKEIAERLKESRALLSDESPEKEPVGDNVDDKDPAPEIRVPVVDYFVYEDAKPQISPEEMSRLYIRQKKYKEAIEILKQLNLNNPKKSIYFADQIRFLERIIANSK